MSEDRFAYRYYKISINIWWFKFYGNTGAHKILRGPLTVVVGFAYSIPTLFLGFWGINIFDKFQGIRNSLEAIQINMTGGEDITKLVTDNDYDDRTKYIFRNLLGETMQRVTIEDINRIAQIQDFYIENKTDLYSERNIDFVKASLSRLKIHRLTRKDIQDIFDAMSQYDKYVTETDIAES